MYHNATDPSLNITKFNISGAPTISGNTVSNVGGTAKNDVFLEKDRYITVKDMLTNTTPIGVTVEEPPTNANAVVYITSESAISPEPACFASDETGYSVAADSGELALRIKTSSSKSRHKRDKSTGATDTSKTPVTTNPDGSSNSTTTNPDGSKTTVTNAKDGSSVTLDTDAKGNMVSAAAKPSAKAIGEAKAADKPVTLPVTMRVAGIPAEAAPLTVDLPAGSGMVRVEVPVENLTPGTVAVREKPDGTTEIIKASFNSEVGVVAPVFEDTTLKFIDNTKEFSDVSGDEWFASYVAWAAGREIMNGVGGGKFDANAKTTQGMMEQILYNLDGNELTAPAEGTPWWAVADSWASNGSIVTGLGDAHDPSAPATREVDVLMMYNYAMSKGYDVSARADLFKFADAGNVSPWAQDAMKWAVAVGLITGTTDKEGNVVLDAQGITIRGQITAITQRFCEKVLK